jgi:hypothetical protein
MWVMVSIWADRLIQVPSQDDASTELWWNGSVQGEAEASNTQSDHHFDVHNTECLQGKERETLLGGE